MNSHYIYFAILTASIAGPLLLSFDKKVAFYKKWKYLLPAIFVPALFYIIWDIIFTHLQIWHFNDHYIAGLKMVNLPVEEVLFFFVVPYCCIFIYECLRCYFPKLNSSTHWNIYLKILALFLLLTSMFFYDKRYTFFSLLFCGIGLLLATSLSSWKKYLPAKTFCLSFLIILIPFLTVNGLLTYLPVVEYNPLDISGIKIYTIPFEDVFYGMLLLLLNILLFEKFRNKKQTP